MDLDLNSVLWVFCICCYDGKLQSVWALVFGCSLWGDHMASHSIYGSSTLTFVMYLR